MSSSLDFSAVPLIRPINDEHCIIEKCLHGLYNQLKNPFAKFPHNPQKCITMPRRISSPESQPHVVIHGQVWRWSHIRPSNLTCQLQFRNFCYAAHQMEICLNPHHYTKELMSLCSQIPLPTPIWASIAYHEKGTRVGEKFSCQGDGVWVHCLENTPPESDRFNLFEIENENREFSVKNTRRQIGKGIKILYVDGKIYLELWSDSDVFINSNFCNKILGYTPETVCRLAPFRCRRVKLFRDDDFHEMLAGEVQKGWEAVCDLAKVCTVRISLVERWGNEVPVTETSCWIEVRFVRQIEWIQRALTQMGAPYKLHS